MAYEAIKIERDSGVTFLYFNRPEKRNAMSPQLCAEMVQALTELEGDDSTEVLVLTGAGEAWTAGMDLKEYFRGLDNDTAGRLKASWDARMFHHYKLRQFPKATIAMVNGWCFGGGFSPLTSCDFAIAAEDAIFGLSEVNWGIVPGGFVSRDVVLSLRYRDALWYCMTGDPFDGKRAAEIGLINQAVPKAELRDTVMALARKLQAISPAVLKATKDAVRTVANLSYDQTWDYLAAKNDQLRLRDPEGSRDRGIVQFIDEKVFRPGLGPQPRPNA